MKKATHKRAIVYKFMRIIYKLLSLTCTLVKNSYNFRDDKHEKTFTDRLAFVPYEGVEGALISLLKRPVDPKGDDSVCRSIDQVCNCHVISIKNHSIE